MGRKSEKPKINMVYFTHDRTDQNSQKVVEQVLESLVTDYIDSGSVHNIDTQYSVGKVELSETKA